jgi:hypothetical protein
MPETCADPHRRTLIRARGHNGIDYVEVGDDQTTLTVTCFGRVPDSLVKENVVVEGGVRVRPLHVVDLRLCAADDPEQDDCFKVAVDRPGDSSTYTLKVVDLDEYGAPTTAPFSGFDPRYSNADFTFKAGLPTDIDCASSPACVPSRPPSPDINYLAKDYTSFRQVILDRLAVTMPDWQESHVPDIGITIVELLAYVGDRLSYLQDAVGTEAYLNTARRRISVRRHVRLLGYAMHDGCNARVWVHVQASADIDPPLDPGRVQFIAGLSGRSNDGAVLSADDLAAVPTTQYELFEPLTRDPLDIRVAHNEISFYTWGDRQCCLPRGSVSATLKDAWEPTLEPLDKDAYGHGHKRRKAVSSPKADEYAEPRVPAVGEEHRTRRLRLRSGDCVLFEEVKSPTSSSAADRDPTHRHVVRLTHVAQAVDPVNDQPVVEVRWAVADALPFDLCLSSAMHPADVSVARGNIVLADHGLWIRDEDLGVVPRPASGSGIRGAVPVRTRFAPSLRNGPITSRQPLAARAPASRALVQDPRTALPQIELQSIAALPDGSGPVFSFAELREPRRLATRLVAVHEHTHHSDRKDDVVATLYLRDRLSARTHGLLAHFDPSGSMSEPLAHALTADMQRFVRRWSPQPTLLNSDREQPDFVVEIDDDGVAHLRFGDGQSGRAPEAGESFSASYRVGNGIAGNIGREVIQHVAIEGGIVQGLTLATNSLPAAGGTASESIEAVKRLAPGSFLNQLDRAITADDYAALAERHPGVQRAAAVLLWTGTRYEARVSIDPLGEDRPDDELFGDVLWHLQRYRRIGHDVAVVGAEYVPLDLEIDVEVSPDYLRGHVKAAVLDTLGTGILPDQSLGFFHPDNLTFGQSIYVSHLIAAVQRITGVQSVRITKLSRLFAEPGDELEAGVLKIGPLEIAQLDNDRLFPERGALRLHVRGGR